MTPDKARDLLDNFDRLLPFEAELEMEGAAKDMARTIAGMTTEHRHEVQSIADGTWHPLTEWAEGEPDRRPWNVTPTRIVRRYVTTPEEA